MRGIDTSLRSLIRSHDEIYDEARNGINHAAQHFLDKVVDKFGKYQSTGGDPNGYGSWKKLKYETIKKKILKGYPKSPLIMTGNTKDSFSVKMGGKGTLAASVSSDSDVLIYHIYGAPGANVPMRDPVRITAKEEMQACHDIIEKYVNDAIRRFE